MATRNKKNRFNRMTIRTVRRDAAVIARQSLYDPLTFPIKPIKHTYLKSRNLLKRLIHVQDYRSYNPDPLPAPLNTSGIHSRVIARGQLPVNRQSIKPIKTFSPLITFKAPRNTIECIRRSIRKEVIFAKGKQGKNRKPKYTDLSHISCKG